MGDKRTIQDKQAIPNKELGIFFIGYNSDLRGLTNRNQVTKFLPVGSWFRHWWEHLWSIHWQKPVLRSSVGDCWFDLVRFERLLWHTKWLDIEYYETLFFYFSSQLLYLLSSCQLWSICPAGNSGIDSVYLCLPRNDDWTYWMKKNEFLKCFFFQIFIFWK